MSAMHVGTTKDAKSSTLATPSDSLSERTHPLSPDATIALDAMGGDDAPAVVVAGTAIAHKRAPHAKFILFGDETRLKTLVDAHPGLSAVCTIVHSDETVADEDKPSQALRKGRQSSMRLAIDAVKAGRAGGVVSAGACR